MIKIVVAVVVTVVIIMEYVYVSLVIDSLYSVSSLTIKLPEKIVGHYSGG